MIPYMFFAIKENTLRVNMDEFNFFRATAGGQCWTIFASCSAAVNSPLIKMTQGQHLASWVNLLCISLTRRLFILHENSCCMSTHTFLLCSSEIKITLSYSSSSFDWPLTQNEQGRRHRLRVQKG